MVSQLGFEPSASGANDLTHYAPAVSLEDFGVGLGSLIDNKLKINNHLTHLHPFPLSGKMRKTYTN